MPELPGCSAFGNSEEKTLEEIKIAIELWLETAKKEGKNIPHPQGKELLNMLINSVPNTIIHKGL